MCSRCPALPGKRHDSRRWYPCHRPDTWLKTSADPGGGKRAHHRGGQDQRRHQRRQRQPEDDHRHDQDQRDTGLRSVRGRLLQSRLIAVVPPTGAGARTACTRSAPGRWCRTRPGCRAARSASLQVGVASPDTGGVTRRSPWGTARRIAARPPRSRLPITMTARPRPRGTAGEHGPPGHRPACPRKDCAGHAAGLSRSGPAPARRGSRR